MFPSSGLWSMVSTMGMLAGFALLYQMPVFRALWFNPPLIVLDFLPVPKQVYMGAVE